VTNPFWCHIIELQHRLTPTLVMLPRITRSSATAELARVGGHYAVQGQSRLPILVPIESLYATFY